jgi:hypothetical protein
MAQEAVYSPEGKHVTQVYPPLKEVGDLSGKVIAELWDYRFRGDVIFRALRKLLTRRYPDIRFVPFDEFGNTHGAEEDENLARLPEILRAEKVDAVISAVGA